MKHISFDPRFVNEAGDGLVENKTHTIRNNYEYWKRYEGKEVALCVWEGKAHQKGSKLKVFNVKRIVSVQRAEHSANKGVFFVEIDKGNFQRGLCYVDGDLLSKNDGFNSKADFQDWFKKYPLDIEMAIIHFTGFRY